MVGESVWLINSFRHYILLGTICKPKNYLKINRKIISASNNSTTYSSELSVAAMRVQTSGFQVDPVMSQHVEVRSRLAFLHRQWGGKVRNSTRLRESHKTWDGMREYEKPKKTHLYLFAFPPRTDMLFFSGPLTFNVAMLSCLLGLKVNCDEADPIAWKG